MQQASPGNHIHPLSPRTSAGFSPRAPLNRSTSAITTTSMDPGIIGKAALENDGSSGVTGPITPGQTATSGDSTSDHTRLQHENTQLALK